MITIFCIYIFIGVLPLNIGWYYFVCVCSVSSVKLIIFSVGICLEKITVEVLDPGETYSLSILNSDLFLGIQKITVDKTVCYRRLYHCLTFGTSTAYDFV